MMTLFHATKLNDTWVEEGKVVSAYDRDHLMSANYNDSELGSVGSSGCHCGYLCITD
jgi:isocitrate lyase